jgi:hypothetical protein
MLAPIYNAVNKLLARWTATKAGYLDAAVSTRAPSSTALTNVTWTDAKAGYLDVAASTRAPSSTALTNATWTDAKAGYLDAAISSRMAGIKGIQRGTVTIASNQTTGTATITSVDPAKTELRTLGASSVVAGESGARSRIALTNATTITATRASANTDTVTVGWELTEYN